MPESRNRILATRKSKILSDSLEVLCLEAGLTKRFRLVTTVNGSSVEFLHEVKPVEFDSAAEAQVEVFLVESMWRLRVTPREIERACLLFDGQSDNDSCSRAASSPEHSLGSLSLLLLECVSRLEVVTSDNMYSLESLEMLDASLSLLESVTEHHPSFDTTRVQSLRNQYQAIWEEAKRRRSEIGN
jgi:hypothetical protein